MLRDLAQDVRSALRSLRQSPSFALLALLALAIGLGANSAIFRVVDVVLLRPLPYPDGDRLVTVWAHDARLVDGTLPVTPADYADWRAQARSFSALAASSDAVFNLTGNGDPEMIIGYAFEPAMFALLGLPAQRGRVFTAEDGDRVVVLSDALWRRRFGADPGTIGRAITLDHESYMVLGVMPPAFQHPSRTDLWVPLRVPPAHAHSREEPILRIVARLAPGVSVAQARAEMRAIAARLANAYPDTNRHRSATVITLRDMGESDIRPTLLVLVGSGGLVLLLVCNHLVSLRLSRPAARRVPLTEVIARFAARAKLISALTTNEPSLLLRVTRTHP